MITKKSIKSRGNPEEIIRVLNLIDKDLKWIIGDMYSINDEINEKLKNKKTTLTKKEIIDTLRESEQWVWGTIIGLESNVNIPKNKEIKSEFAGRDLQIPESIIEIRIQDAEEIILFSKDKKLIERITKKNEK